MTEGSHATAPNGDEQLIFLTFSGTHQSETVLTAGEKERCRWDKENEKSNFSVGDDQRRDAVNKKNCQSCEILIFHLDCRGKISSRSAAR